MSVNRNKIVKFCEDYLEVKKFPDYCVDGLQVEGADKVEKIITGVSLSIKLINEAIRRKAQMIIVHHGIFKDQIGTPPQITGYVAKRLKLILANDINLCGFHLPLDVHSVIGNNISLAKLIGLTNIKPLNTRDYGYIGYIGYFKKPILFSELVQAIDKKLKTKSYNIPAGEKYVKCLGIVSGGASPDFKDAFSSGADAFLSGDVRESVVEAVWETGINFINAGHYNTEKLGIQNLGNLIAKKFKVKVEFLDIPNEI
jgi:dinuclear metal center YbgI/SA1388 family protein